MDFGNPTFRVTGPGATPSSLIIGSVRIPKRKEITMSKIKDSLISFSGQHFYVGIDVHKKGVGHTSFL